MPGLPMGSTCSVVTSVGFSLTYSGSSVTVSFDSSRTFVVLWPSAVG